MHHIVQNDMANEFGFHTLLTALRESGSPFTVVKIVPFSHELTWFDGEPIPTDSTPAMAWGMTCVEELSATRGWVPGVFKNENFDLRVIGQKYGHYMLNADAEFYPLGSIPKFEGARFIRPVHDTKSFTGTVINGDELEVWQKQLFELRHEFTTLDLNTMVAVSSPKRCNTEARFFVVDGEVITGSTYRVDGWALRKRVDSSNPLYLPLRKFAQMMTNIWQPAQAFVIDVAQVDEEMKVIEINCLNSSGFYDCDMNAVVRAIEHRRSQWVQPIEGFVRV